MEKGSIETRPGFNRIKRRSPEENRKFHEAAEAEYGIEAKILEAIDNGRKLMIKNPTTGGVERYRPKNLVISVWQKPEVPTESDQAKSEAIGNPQIL